MRRISVIAGNFFEHLHDHFVPNARNNYKPHFIAHRSLSLYAAFLISVKIFTLFSVSLLPQNQAASSAVNLRNILELTNYSRQSFGLSPLQENSKLDAAAQAKAQDMLQNQYFAHNSPQGKTPWDFITAQGYNYLVAGENLAINFYSSEGVSEAWMNSPEHKANILNKDFEDIGIGIAEGQFNGVNAIFVVQMFGTSINQPIIPQNNFSNPQPLAKALPSISLPRPSAIGLQQPTIDDPGFYLTNKKDLAITGAAPGASFVYILVNHQPYDEFKVENGMYNARIVLNEGNNVLNAVSFNNSEIASPVSKDLRLTLDSSAPQILKADITPKYQGDHIIYDISVQVAGNPVNVFASLGQDSAFLQPGNDPQVWTGQVDVSGAQIQNQLTISAYDLAGNTTLSRVATFTSSTQDNYSFVNPPAHPQTVDFFGKVMPVREVNMIYIYFSLFLLGMIGLTIAIKKHIQHLGIIAHASSMVALALMLWLV